MDDNQEITKLKRRVDTLAGQVKKMKKEIDAIRKRDIKKFSEIEWNLETLKKYLHDGIGNDPVLYATEDAQKGDIFTASTHNPSDAIDAEYEPKAGDRVRITKVGQDREGHKPFFNVNDEAILKFESNNQGCWCADFTINKQYYDDGFWYIGGDEANFEVIKKAGK